MPPAHRGNTCPSFYSIPHPRKKDKNQLQERKKQNQTYDIIVAVQCHHINLVLENFK